MPRPPKCRKIFSNPDVLYFKPACIMLKDCEEVTLTLDEFEAVRLADYEGLYQEKAAAQMNISRQTFGNIINSAHRKIADFLVNAKALQITGGTIEILRNDKRNFACDNCKKIFDIPYGMPKQEICPNCNSTKIWRSETD
jgi:uncharacterized protein